MVLSGFYLVFGFYLTKEQEGEKLAVEFRTLCLFAISFIWANAVSEIKLNIFLKLSSSQMAMSCQKIRLYDTSTGFLFFFFLVFWGLLSYVFQHDALEEICNMIQYLMVE